MTPSSLLPPFASTRRHLLAVLAASGLLPWHATARANASPEAVATFVTTVLQQQVLPRLQQFGTLADALVAACEAWQRDGEPRRAAARTAWQQTLLAWAQCHSVAVGPLVERRSARRIDFSPTRAPQVQKAIDSAPRDAAAMEQIGASAKGFGALEWLLWDAKAPRSDAARHYAVMLAREIAVEAAGVLRDFAALLQAPRGPDESQALLAEILNQWVGGAEHLAMQGLMRPAQGLAARGKAALPRSASGAAAAERAARWQALRAMLQPPGTITGPGGAAAAATAPTLEGLLRAAGDDTLADRLRAAVPATDRALQGAAGNQQRAMEQASRLVAVLKGVVEFDAAPALDVQIGFSDSDGD